MHPGTVLDTAEHISSQFKVSMAGLWLYSMVGSVVAISPGW